MANNMTRENTDGRTFDQWIREANRICSIITGGLTLDDLPDSDTYDAWDASERPKEFVLSVLAEEGFPL